MDVDFDMFRSMFEDHPSGYDYSYGLGESGINNDGMNYSVPARDPFTIELPKVSQHNMYILEIDFRI